MLDGAGEDVPRLGEIVASVEQALDRHAVARPLLDLVEVASVRKSGSRVSSSDQSLTGTNPGQWGRSSLTMWTAGGPFLPDPQCRGSGTRTADPVAIQPHALRTRWGRRRRGLG